jgi:hypothetical protein
VILGKIIFNLLKEKYENFLINNTNFIINGKIIGKKEINNSTINSSDSNDKVGIVDSGNFDEASVINSNHCIKKTFSLESFENVAESKEKKKNKVHFEVDTKNNNHDNNKSNKNNNVYNNKNNNHDDNNNNNHYINNNHHNNNNNKNNDDSNDNNNYIDKIIINTEINIENKSFENINKFEQKNFETSEAFQFNSLSLIFDNNNINNNNNNNNNLIYENNNENNINNNNNDNKNYLANNEIKNNQNNNNYDNKLN